MLAVLVVLRKFWYFPNWRGTQLTFQSFRFNFVTGQNTQTIRRICMYGKTSPKAHISRHALIESDGRRMEEPTPSNSPRPRAMYNHLLQTGSCHCFAHHHHHKNDQKSSSPLSCGSIVSQIRVLHRESVSRATDRPLALCSFLSDLFLAWISGSLNTLTF